MYRGRGEKCGYNKNYAALGFDHLDSYAKSFQLDLRSQPNRRCSVIVEEAKKCALLCSNCHAELCTPDGLME